MCPAPLRPCAPAQKFSYKHFSSVCNKGACPLAHSTDKGFQPLVPLFTTHTITNKGACPLVNTCTTINKGINPLVSKKGGAL
jgi:hypothetical protein